jgi:hypothetical protein
MSSSVSTRGSHGDQGARPGRQAPRSGWQGAVSGRMAWARAGRPADVIAVARELAEGKA